MGLGMFHHRDRSRLTEILHDVDKYFLQPWTTNLMFSSPCCGLLGFQHHLLARNFALLTMTVLDDLEDSRVPFGHENSYSIFWWILLGFWILWRQFEICSHQISWPYHTARSTSPKNIHFSVIFFILMYYWLVFRCHWDLLHQCSEKKVDGPSNVWRYFLECCLAIGHLVGHVAQRTITFHRTIPTFFW